jgi:hypothetical protein
VTEVLDLLAMWALLQVLFVWCFARAAGLRAHGYEGEIRPVDTPTQPGCTASPYMRSNSGSTTNLCKRGLGEGSQRVTVSVSLRRPRGRHLSPTTAHRQRLHNEQPGAHEPRPLLVKPRRLP